MHFKEYYTCKLWLAIIKQLVAYSPKLNLINLSKITEQLGLSDIIYTGGLKKVFSLSDTLSFNFRYFSYYKANFISDPHP